MFEFWAGVPDGPFLARRPQLHQTTRAAAEGGARVGCPRTRSWEGPIGRGPDGCHPCTYDEVWEGRACSRSCCWLGQPQEG